MPTHREQFIFGYYSEIGESDNGWRIHFSEGNLKIDKDMKLYTDYPFTDNQPIKDPDFDAVFA